MFLGANTTTTQHSPNILVVTRSDVAEAIGLRATLLTLTHTVLAVSRRLLEQQRVRSTTKSAMRTYRA